jgi:membrane protease YdiL (CAAX protease family)
LPEWLEPEPCNVSPLNAMASPARASTGSARCSVAASISTGLNGGKPGIRRLFAGFVVTRTRPIWYLAALFGPGLLCVTVLALHALMGGELPFLKSTLFLHAAQIFGVYLLLNTEEIAWRGYAQPRLQALLGERRTALFLGVLWSVFHMPLFLLAGGHPAGYPMPAYLLMLVGFNVIFTRFYNLTGGSLLLVHFLHQSFNAWAEALPFFPTMTGSLRPFYFAVGLIWIVALVILLDRDQVLDRATSAGDLAGSESIHA